VAAGKSEGGDRNRGNTDKIGKDIKGLSFLGAKNDNALL